MTLNIKINDNLNIDFDKHPHLLVYGRGLTFGPDSYDKFKNNIFYTEKGMRYAPCVLNKVASIHAYYYKWTNECSEIEQRLNERYQLFNALNVKNITEFNEQFKIERMKYAVAFVTVPTSVKNVDLLKQILEKGRAAGIIMIMFVNDLWRVQRYNVLDMFTTKIIFGAKTEEESILLTGEKGAENLGYGDVMLSELGKKPVIFSNNMWLYNDRPDW